MTPSCLLEIFKILPSLSRGEDVFPKVISPFIWGGIVTTRRPPGYNIKHGVSNNDLEVFYNS